MSNMQSQAETHDHMGRKIVDTKAEEFKQDLPWIIALIGTLVFTVMALAGYFRI